jgi:hypothetical protein
MASGLFIGCEFTGVGEALGPPVMLDARDLLTHGLIVGMTGSGKTGLGIDLIEEVLRSGVPVLVVDPKGDIGNLLLLLDDFSGKAHAPWIGAEQARRSNKALDELARDVAQAWERGLAEWGLAGKDVAELRACHEAAILTPGSQSGIPLNVMSALAGPSSDARDDAESLQAEIGGLATGLLGWLGRDPDPLGREAVLLAHLIEGAWQRGERLTLEDLVGLIARPPFDRLGALPLETVYPSKQREELMLAVNNLLAAPGFAAWMTGVPFEIDRLLRASDGRPRLSIISTAHLAEAERLFLTALLLNKLTAWMRRQPGTGDLRVLLYIDEIFGYVPPHPANPVTKQPLLTLLKQARSQGIGVVLATQNPVDLDYKGLSNIGTWVVGRLQTQQDRDRLKDGLMGAGADGGSIEAALDAARERVFLLHDVHRTGPTLFRSRHAMSFLRGPLTRVDIERLMAGRRESWAGAAAPAQEEGPHDEEPPLMPPPWRNHFVDKYGGQVAEPYVFVQYMVKYEGAEEVGGMRAYRMPDDGGGTLLEGQFLEISKDDLRSEPVPGLRYSELPAWLATLGARGVERLLRDRLPDKLALCVLADPVTKLVSEPGETRDAFAARVGRTAESSPRLAKLREQIERKQADLTARRQELSSRRSEKWFAIGSAILANVGLLTGRKRRVTGAASVLSKNRMENSAEARVEALETEIRDLEEQVRGAGNVDPTRLTEETLTPRRSAVKILRYDIAWVW